MAKKLASYTALLRAQEAGLLIVIVALCVVIASFAGSYVDRQTGLPVNTFLNARSLIQVSSDTSLFAIMAVGATIVIISGGIDLSVGSIYALAAVSTALYMKHSGSHSMLMALGMCVAIGTLCGALNGAMVSYLKVHPFIITLGTMWIFRGLSYVISKAVSISFPDSAIAAVKSNLGLQAGLYPVPTIVMVLVSLAGVLYLSKTTGGRNVYALGGNEQASRYSGIRIGRVLVGVYTLAGLTAGIAAFIGSSFYGAASCADAQGYELKVIASAVVGGASLTGGKGGAFGALLGAIVINLIGQAITYLHLSRDYESIIIGFAVVFAVLLDQWSRKLAQRRVTGQ
ncbi:MAG TPA: ABC transporter permease [Fimbriimonadaceae bacterium]|nr:ABC transporter permease [Fimbriimonadaceae bacterium]